MTSPFVTITTFAVIAGLLVLPILKGTHKESITAYSFIGLMAPSLTISYFTGPYAEGRLVLLKFEDPSTTQGEGYTLRRVISFFITKIGQFRNHLKLIVYVYDLIIVYGSIVLFLVVLKRFSLAAFVVFIIFIAIYLGSSLLL